MPPPPPSCSLPPSLGPVDALRRRAPSGSARSSCSPASAAADAPPLLLVAAQRLDPLDAEMARETYLEALAAAMYAGRLGDGPDERAVAVAARAAARPRDPGPADLLLDALVIRFTDGYAAGVAPLSRALDAFAGPDGGGEDRRWLWLACRLAQDLWDDELWERLATGGVRIARESGALNLLPVMTNYLAAFEVHRGAFSTAAALIDEVDAIPHATGLPPLKYAAAMLLAAQGDLVAARPLFEGPAERPRARRGLGARPAEPAARADEQRQRPLRGGARGGAARLRARGGDGVRLGARRAGRGGRPQRSARTRRPPRSRG